MATLEEIQAEAARRGLTALPDIRAIAAAELARRQAGRVDLRPIEGESREAYRARVEAARAGFQPNAGTTEMTGLAAADMQTARDEQLLGQFPILARASEFSRGIPFVGSYIDEAADALRPGSGALSRQMNSAMERQNPNETMAYNVLGGVAGSIPAAVLAAPSVAAVAPAAMGARVAGAFGLGTAVGGVEGAVYGYGEGTDPTSRAAAAQQGGALGAAVGGLLGAASPLVGAGIRQIMQRLKGTDVSTIMSTLGIGRPAAIMVRDAIQAGDASAAEAALRRAGPDAMLADSTVATRQLLDTAGQSGGPAGQTIRDAVGGRTQQATRDMTAAMDDTLGLPDGQQSLIDGIRTGTAPQRNAAYEAAYASPIDYSSPDGMRIESLLSRVPASAIRRAQQLMQIEGVQSRQIFADIADDGTVTYSRMPDVRQLDYITRALRDVAAEADGQGKLGGTTDLGRVTGNLASEIRKGLRRAVPAYGEALDTAADAISRRQAVDLGYSLLSKATRREDVAQALAGASTAERKAAMEGLRAYLDETTSNVVRTITDPDTTTREGIRMLRDFSSRASQTKLRILLGVDEADKLLTQIDQAATAFELRAAIAENSKTAIRQATQRGVREAASDGILRTLAAGEPVNAIKRLTQALTGETAEARQLREMGIYQQIARALTEVRGAQAEGALRIIQSAVARQSTMSELQAQAVARALVTANLSGQRASAFLAADQEGTRTR